MRAKNTRDRGTCQDSAALDQIQGQPRRRGCKVPSSLEGFGTEMRKAIADERN